MQIKDRDYFFDNIKGLMIILVVLGHFVSSGLYKNSAYISIWYSIYLFHMPMFIFIAGYFTKDDKDNPKKAVKNFLIPYIIVSVIMYAFKLIVLKQNIDIEFLEPQYGLWFLISMFWYKLAYNGFIKIKGIFIISIILAILVGLDESFTNLAAFSRTIVFLPFFIAGNKFNKKYIVKNKLIKFFMILILPMLFCVFLYFCYKYDLPMGLLESSIPYQNLKLDIRISMLFRSLVIFLGFLIIYIILNFIPSKKTIFSLLGRNSIIIYLGHLFVILFCRKYGILAGCSYITLIKCLIATVLVVGVLCLPLFKKIYDFVINKIYSLLFEE